MFSAFSDCPSLGVFPTAFSSRREALLQDAEQICFHSLLHSGEFGAAGAQSLFDHPIHPRLSRHLMEWRDGET